MHAPLPVSNAPFHGETNWSLQHLGGALFRLAIGFLLFCTSGFCTPTPRRSPQHSFLGPFVLYPVALKMFLSGMPRLSLRARGSNNVDAALVSL
jgi:hypothetical protein